MKSEKNLSIVEAPDLQPNWKNSPSQRTLAEDLNTALSDHQSMVARVSEWRKHFENRPESREVRKSDKDKLKTRSTYTAKLIRKQCEWRYPALSEPFLSTPDLFKVSPMTHLDVLAARQNELVLNQQFNTVIARVHFFDTYVRSLVNNGTAIVKTSWKERKGKVLQEVNEVEFVEAADKFQEQEIATWIQLFQEDPDRFEQLVTPEWEEAINMTMENNIPIYPIITGTKSEYVEAITANHPELTVCNYKNVIIDPTCKGKVQDAKFIIHMFETCLGDLKADGRYKNLDYINTNEASPLASPDSYDQTNMVSFKFADEARKKVVAYEYWGYRDIDGSGVLTPIVATWVGNTLIQLEYSPYPEGYLPFVVVPYMPLEESVYGEADAELLKDNQAVVGAIQRGMIDSMARSSNGQIGYRKDALDAMNSRKLQAGDDFEYNPNVDPATAFHQWKYPEIPQSAMLMIEMNTAEAEALTGVKSFTGGISGSSVGNTATGVRSAMDATAKRDSDILRRAGEGVVQIGRQMMMMNSLFLDKEEIVRITDDDYVPIKKEDLQGKFDLRLTISTAETDNQKAEELSFMLQTTASFVGFDMTKIILSEIARLRKMPDLARKIETFVQQPDPLAQKKAELEIALLEAQIQNELASAAKKQAEADTAPVIAQTEAARQRKLTTEADLNDLEFLEQERGVKQERELQKAQAQAEGNIKLEAVKAQLNKGVKNGN